ncbi:MAG: hypothetical protein H7256_09615 [Bdellovibrio sp.]|nr:hypothetical protein [Bdellovibrio sp.]
MVSQFKKRFLLSTILFNGFMASVAVPQIRPNIERRVVDKQQQMDKALVAKKNELRIRIRKTIRERIENPNNKNFQLSGTESSGGGSEDRGLFYNPMASAIRALGEN